MNYEGMSDFEINCKVAKLFIGGVSVYHERSHGNHDGDVWLNDSETGALRWTNFNPCNSPSDAWPIIIENKISLSFLDDGEIYASQGDLPEFPWVKFEHAGRENPLRIAMICFLKMKDAEK